MATPFIFMVIQVKRETVMTVIKWHFYPLLHEALTFLLKNDTSIFFRPRFEADLDLLILLSSPARGSKLILIYWYFYPPPLEVRSWPWNGDFLTWLDLHWIANLVLFWSCTCRPIKLGSVPVLPWKPVKLGSRILPCVYLLGLYLYSSDFLPRLTLHCQCFFIYLLTWTYFWLPVWLRFWLCHAYLLDWTYNSDAILVGIWNSLEILIYLNYLLFLEGLSEAFIKCETLFHSTFLFQDKKTYTWCKVPCNVWLCMNEMSKHINSFFIWIRFIPFLGFIACLARVLCTDLLFWFTMLLSFSRKIFCLDDSLPRHNFPVLGVWMLWFIDSFLVGK